MFPNARMLARAVALVAFLTATLSPSVMPQAVAVTSHKTLNDTRAVGAAPVRVDFPIEYFGLVADLETPSSHLPARGRAPYGEVRFHVRGRWTPWRAVEQDGAQQPGQFTAALVSVGGADAYQVRGLPRAGHNWRAAALNTTDGPSVTVGHARADSAAASPMCMSRADWGADESISGWSNGESQTHHPVQVLTVHHTAGSNNLNQDYAATVRAMYSYHVETNQWPDIGYQYLIDGEGVVYEGTNAGHTSQSCLYDGGDGSDFAHQAGTDYVVTGTHVANNNSGNAGVALMGCYEPASSACTGDTQPTPVAMGALRSLTGSLSARHGLDPDSTVHYVNPVSGATRDVAAISGHRDWNATECPGGHLYAQLPTVRTSTVAFQQASRAVAENIATPQVTVSRSGNTALPATVDYAATSGTASPNSDYTLTPGTLSFAAGQRTKTIPVTINNDTAREGRETIGISLNNAGENTTLGNPASATVTITPSDQQPDALVSTAANSGYLGNNVYNGTGNGQTKTVRARRTNTRTFHVRVYNDGNVKNTISVKGSASKAGSRVRYYAGTSNITTAMRSAAGWKAMLQPAGYKQVTVRITVLRGAAIGSQKPATVRGVWVGDGTRTDLARAVVNVHG